MYQLINYQMYPTYNPLCFTGVLESVSTSSLDSASQFLLYELFANLIW